MEYGGYPDQAVSTDADFRLPESQECDRTFLIPPEDALRNTYKVRPHSTRTVNHRLEDSAASASPRSTSTLHKLVPAALTPSRSLLYTTVQHLSGHASVVCQTVLDFFLFLPVLLKQSLFAVAHCAL